MPFLCVFVLIISLEVSWAFPPPVDTLILQIQQWGVVGDQRVVDQVFLNGISFTNTSQEVGKVIQSLSADALLPALININQTLLLRNQTILRSRECILEGSQLHWSDRVFCNGKVYLTLDLNEQWKANIPQALALKEVWDQKMQNSKVESVQLQKGCIKLIKDLRLPEEHSAVDAGISLPKFLIPIMAFLTFSGLIIITLVVSKDMGLRQPGDLKDGLQIKVNLLRGKAF
ncbi:uncharacterized protein LOC114478937 isoform X2 [Gouania willdenowi]|uniref:uncharacterized protein LOC114478937 isoform X2 n=1 Tax=Gouania willdenowi TaxID=441366 RepID=UPI001054FDB1|nr:uncharacterized protein LOC114478937 isoform X2 [Gouania willdenowi]